MLVIIELAGAHVVGRDLEHLRPAWIGMVAVAQLVTYPAYVAPIILLVTGSNIGGALLWPRAAGLPALIGCALQATAPQRVERLSRPFGRQIDIFAHVLDGISSVRAMARRPSHFPGAWLGTTLHWAAEIGALWAALRAAGLDLGIVRTVLAYATGYVASRRSLPLGGAGWTDALLVYSLYELQEPLGPAIDAVMIYRLLNFMLVVVPALVAYRGLQTVPAEPRVRFADDWS